MKTLGDAPAAPNNDPILQSSFALLQLTAVAEKLVFALPVLAFVALGRTLPVMAGFAAIDIALGVGFWLAWRQTTPT